MYVLKSTNSMFHKFLFICLINVFMIFPPAIFSQISFGGRPPGFDYSPSLRSAIPVTKVPIDFYIEDLRETDEWQARDGVPMPISKLIPVNYSMANSGYHTQLPDGENIWQLHLSAKDAVAIMLYYNDFYIPEGGKLFIYKPDKSQLLGAYTHRTHPSGGLFATEFIGGDELILEYVASTLSDELPRIVIGDIGYGYNIAALREYCGITTRAISGNCNVNINCDEGKAWQNEKKGVCYTVQRIGSRNYMCTGSLMNNTALDFKPLILTASHCAHNGSTFASANDMEQWVFSFNREREACSDTTGATIPNSMTGCSLLTNTGMSGGSDGLLLLLNHNIPEDYDVFYNGWDRSGDIAVSGVSIHHPQGDQKKISTYDEPVRTTTFQSNEFNGDTQAHWNVIFKATTNGHGVTEEGSSGCPLYNENKLVVGTLTGGNSSCSYLRGLNLYGKLSYHWDRYKTDSTRMDVWLDPLKTGVKTFPGRFLKEPLPPPLNLKAVNLGHSVSLTWDAPESDEQPHGYNVYRNNIKMSETNSLEYIDITPPIGSISYSVSAVYDKGEESEFVTSTLFFIKYKAPVDIKAELIENTRNQIELSWVAPKYEQTIYWGTLTPSYTIGFGDKIPFYFGQLWSADEIEPLHQKTIKAVQFYHIGENSNRYTYEIYINQGEHFYRQPVETSSFKQNGLYTINLTTPFVIDGSMSLIVSFYTSQVSNYSYQEHDPLPATCDDGPAVNGKGNICSVDGEEWFRLNDGEEPGSYDYNFIVTAIVSSESENLSVSSKNGIVRDYNPLSSHKTILLDENPALPRKTALPLDENPVFLRNSVPASFPEITKYRVYRNGSYLKEVDASQTSCIDTDLSGTVYYHVSAFYDLLESEKSDSVFITVEVVDTSIRLYPVPFTNSITLQGYENVSRIEAVSVSGLILFVVNNPEQEINTSSLAPGIYFFRIYDINKKLKVIKTIKM